MLTQPAALSPQTDLTPLEAFPWLVQSAAVAPAVSRYGRKARADRKQFLLHAAIAAGFAVLCAGVSVLTGGAAEDPAPAVQQTHMAHAAALPGAAAATQVGGAESGATGKALTRGPVAPAARQDVPPRASSAPARLVTRAPAPLPRIEPSRVDAEPMTTDAVSSLAAPPSATADNPAAGATLREFRKAIDEGRDAARDVIRLGNRHRPKHGASAEDTTRYRLRQQNAEAAKTYRTYLDTLARTVRAARSETLTRQSLERARQTLGYLTTMLEDSRVSLR